LRLGLVYLGLHDSEPRFRLDAERAGSIQRLDATVAGRWDVLGSGASELRERFPSLRGRRLKLSLDVRDADERSARLPVSSSMRLVYQGEWDVAGLHLGDLLEMPDPVAELVGWVTRRGEVGLGELAERTGRDTGAARALLAPLVERGIVAETNVTGEPRYAARAAERRGGRLSQEVWRGRARPPSCRGARRATPGRAPLPRGVAGAGRARGRRGARRRAPGREVPRPDAAARDRSWQDRPVRDRGDPGVRRLPGGRGDGGERLGGVGRGGTHSPVS